MNTTVFYLAVTIWAVAGLWTLWNFGIKALVLDSFRDSLFEIRDRLYHMAQDGKINCDSDAYRSVEWFINSIIRYAHRITFFPFVLSKMEAEKNQKKEDEEYSADIFQKINSVCDPHVRDELNEIMLSVGSKIPAYIAKSSLFFIAMSLIYLVVRVFQPVLARQKKSQAVMIFEKEVFKASETDSYARVW